MISSGNAPKIKFLFRKIVLKTPTNLRVISTKGLTAVEISSDSESNAIFKVQGKYGTDAFIELYSTDDERNAKKVMAALHESLGVMASLGMGRVLRKVIALGLAFWVVATTLSAFVGSSGGGNRGSVASGPQISPTSTTGASTADMESLEEARAQLKQRLKAAALSAADSAPEHYQFSPRITVPPIVAPDLNCAPKQVPQKLSANK